MYTNISVRSIPQALNLTVQVVNVSARNATNTSVSPLSATPLPGPKAS